MYTQHTSRLEAYLLGCTSVAVGILVPGRDGSVPCIPAQRLAHCDVRSVCSVRAPSSSPVLADLTREAAGLTSRARATCLESSQGRQVNSCGQVIAYFQQKSGRTGCPGLGLGMRGLTPRAQRRHPLHPAGLSGGSKLVWPETFHRRGSPSNMATPANPTMTFCR